MMRNIFKALASPTLSNPGSTARDHLASERTFLAWLRTGLGFIALGLAIERLSKLEPLIQRSLVADSRQAVSFEAQTAESRRTYTPKGTDDTQSSVRLATSFTVLGSVAILYGTQRYVANLRMLQKGLFKPAYWGVAGFVGSVIGMSGYGIWDTFTERKSSVSS